MKLSIIYQMTLFKSIVVAVLFQLTIAPGIQLIGWLYMIPTYALQSGSIVQGLEETFSGDKPCYLCKAAADLNEAESNQHQQKAKEDKHKKYLLIEPLVFYLDTHAIFATDSYRLSQTVGKSLIEIPPPRFG